MLTKRESVLIADDNSIVRQGLQLFLEESGMEVVGLAADGKQAIEKTQKLDPDLLLLDIVMPIMDGLQALATIKKSQSRTRVIMLTAVNDPSTLKHALALGADALLLKDDGPDSLKRAISAALAGNMLYIGWDAMKAGAGLA